MSAVAGPIGQPYLITAAPRAIGASATLCPRPTVTAARMSRSANSASPGAISAVAVATLSASWTRSAPRIGYSLAFDTGVSYTASRKREMRKMLATSDHENLARVLIDARALKTPLTAYPGAMPQTMAEAYAIQDSAIALDGRRIGGWKVGRIAPELVTRYGGNRLTGPIFADEIFDGAAGEPAMPVYADGFAAAEAEVLLCFGEVGPRAYDIDSVRGCIADVRSEEHTSELQSLMRNSYAVFCLKKKK